MFLIKHVQRIFKKAWQGTCDFLKHACVILLGVSAWGKVHLCDLIFLPQVEDDEERSAAPASENSCRGEDISVNLQPTNAYEFGQALNAARCSGNTAACADLLASTTPEMLPQLLSTQLDGHTVGFMMQALDSHLVEKNPNLVYQHLNHLHTAERFSVRCNVPLLKSLLWKINGDTILQLIYMSLLQRQMWFIHTSGNIRQSVEVHSC